ncbi:MAG: hypothetical protein ACREMY_17885 [bacterium]
MSKRSLPLSWIRDDARGWMTRKYDHYTSIPSGRTMCSALNL